MTESNNLKGIAWDIFSLDWGRRLGIRRLDFIKDSAGRLVGPNDIFPNDQAAREFVGIMAEHGDPDCKLAIEMVGQYEEDLCNKS